MGVGRGRVGGMVDIGERIPLLSSTSLGEQDTDPTTNPRWKINRFFLGITDLPIHWRVLWNQYKFSNTVYCIFLCGFFWVFKIDIFDSFIVLFTLSSLHSFWTNFLFYISRMKSIPLLISRLPLPFLDEYIGIFPGQLDCIILVHIYPLVYTIPCPLLRKESNQNLWRNTETYILLYFPREWECLPTIVELS